MGWFMSEREELKQSIQWSVLSTGRKYKMSGITKDRKHDHFWIENGVLYETYRTIRGLRYREKFEVPNFKDTTDISLEELNAKLELANGTN